MNLYADGAFCPQPNLLYLCQFCRRKPLYPAADLRRQTVQHSLYSILFHTSSCRSWLSLCLSHSMHIIDEYKNPCTNSGTRRS
ncbi:MAG: hypothetical protein ACLSFT_00730 [Ruminococcus callidus]